MVKVFPAHEPVRELAREMDQRWGLCGRPGKAGRRNVECVAPRGHAGSCVGTHPVTGNVVFWGRGLQP